MDEPVTVNDIEAPVSTERDAACVSAWNVVHCLTDPGWWRRVWQVVVRFAPACILPAAVTFVFDAAAFLSQAMVSERMRQQPVAPADIYVACLILLLGSCIAFPAFGWSVAAWLMRLTALAHACFQSQPLRQGTIADKAIDMEIFKVSHTVAKERLGYITQFYLFLAVYLALPTVLLISAATIALLYLFPQRIAGETISVPANLGLVSLFAALLSGAILSAISLNAIVVSANSRLPAGKAAGEAIVQTLFNFMPSMLVTAVFLTLGYALSDPLGAASLLGWSSAAGLQSNLAVTAGLAFWQCCTSVIFLPLLTLIYCELLRGRIK